MKSNITDQKLKYANLTARMDDMDILANTNDKIFISVHRMVGAQQVEIIDTLLHPPDNIAARRIKIANIEITLFERKG